MLCILHLTYSSRQRPWLPDLHSCAFRGNQCTLWRLLHCYMTSRTGSTATQRMPAEHQCRCVQ